MARVRRFFAAAIIIAACAASVGCSGGGQTSIVPAPTFSPRAVTESSDPVAQYAQDRLASMNLRQKVLSMLMVHVPGTRPGTGAGPPRDNVGGVILMGDNIPDSLSQLREETAALSDEVGLPVLVATDQEGGIVRRVPTDAAAAASQLRSQPPSASFDAFAERGALLESVGVSVNFGIVADIVSDPSSFLFERSYGATAAAVAPRVAAAVSGETHVFSTLKHFPGHGAASGDSHSSIPTTSLSVEDWRAAHARPFTAGIGAGASIVMFGHLTFTAVDPQPATFSNRWHEILRNDLGFEGVVITDDMGMLENSGVPQYSDQSTNAVRAIAAGNTMLLYVGPVDTEAIVDAVKLAIQRGELAESMIDDSALALLTLRRSLSGETGRFVHCSLSCAAMAN